MQAFEAEAFVTELDFTGVDQLTDLYFWALKVKCGQSTVCKTLEKLTVQGCLYLTDDAVTQISKTFPNLKEVNLSKFIIKFSLQGAGPVGMYKIS